MKLNTAYIIRIGQYPKQEISIKQVTMELNCSSETSVELFLRNVG
jgi:hypothetical protein